MARKYTISLKKYGISNAKLEELRGFCHQYSEKKARIGDELSLKSPEILKDIKSNAIADPVVAAEEKMAQFLADVELIEKTAQEVDEFLAPWIIKSVTQDIPIRKLISLYNMPTNEKTFAIKRRQFFCLLAIKKRMI